MFLTGDIRLVELKIQILVSFTQKVIFIHVKLHRYNHLTVRVKKLKLKV